MLPVFAGSEVAIPEGTKVSFEIESVKKVGSHPGVWKKAGAAVVRAFTHWRRSGQRNMRFVCRRPKLRRRRQLGCGGVGAAGGYAVMIEPNIGKVARFVASSRRARSLPRQERRQTVILRLDEGALWPTLTVHTLSGADKFKHVRCMLFADATQRLAQPEDDAFQAVWRNLYASGTNCLRRAA